jgi:hypothetical protein
MEKIHLQFSHFSRCLEGPGGLPNAYSSRGYSLYPQREFGHGLDRMKQQADQGRFERKFTEGDQVFLRLQPYKKNSLKVNHCQKLAPKFYGPYTILKHVG